MDEDEPPTKKKRGNSTIQVGTEISKEGTLKLETVVVNEMVNMGFSHKEVEAGVQENWGGIMKEEMFLTSLKDVLK